MVEIPLKSPIWSYYDCILYVRTGLPCHSTIQGVVLHDFLIKILNQHLVLRHSPRRLKVEHFWMDIHSFFIRINSVKILRHKIAGI